MKIAQFIVRTILAIIFLVILYHFALNGRYQVILNSPYMIDKWTNTAIEPKNWKEFTKQISSESETSSSESQQTEQSDDNYEEQ